MKKIRKNIEISVRLIALFLVIGALFAIMPAAKAEETAIRTGKVWDYVSGGEVKTKANGLIVRTGVGTSNPQCGYLIKGAYVTVDGEGKDSKTGITWYHIVYTDMSKGYTVSGYVNGRYIAFCDVPQYTYDATFEEEMDKQGFPESYKPYLRQLHAQYPNWVFKAQKSVLDWKTALDTQTLAGESEYTASNIKSLINADNCKSSWKATDKNAYDWTTGKWTTGFDSGNLVVASREITAYYMDPRNFLTTEGVFMFMDHTYHESQTVEGVRTIVSDTFLSVSDSGSVTLEMNKTNKTYNNGDNSVYLETDGTVIDYAEAIYQAGKENNVNPYVLASMMIQEVGSGKGKSVSKIINGEYTGAKDRTVYRWVNGTAADGTVYYDGYFNYYNIGAYAEDGRTAIERGLLYAKGWTEGANTSYGRPWNSRYKALCGGAKFMYESYTGKGQNTYYLKKFNIQSSTCAHQWMTNVDGCYGESLTLSRGYDEQSRKNALTFIIPVYDNMPSGACPMPMKDGSPNNKLSDIQVGGYVLSPAFDMDCNSYTVNIVELLESVEVTVSVYDDKATVTCDGVDLSKASGTKSFSYTKNLVYGYNPLTIAVTAENGDVRTYRVNVVRKLPSNVVSGWNYIDNSWYYLDPDNGNRIATGWKKIDGAWYYMNENGIRQEGWVYSKGWYYLDPAENGKMVTGWKKIDGNWYFLNKSGSMKIGWLQDGGNWYYLDPLKSGRMAIGWTKAGNDWYYMGQNGSMKTGWLQDGGKWYYLDASKGGRMATGWLCVGKDWYYMDASGAMQEGWIYLNGKWYYLDASKGGRMATGWLRDGKKWYYLDKDGAMYTGWLYENGKWYYLNPNKGGQMATGYITVDKKKYYMNSNGVWVR